MSYEHGTPFLNLPQTTGDDKRDWFDTNAAFLELDSKLKAAYEGSIDTADALASLTEIVSGISTNVETLDGTVSDHTTSISTINEALTLINSALASLNTSVQGKFDSAGIADPYDAEHGIYDVGDVVTYSGQRYECVTAVTAAEPFDADKWNAVDVQTKLDAINAVLSKKIIVAATNTETFSESLDRLFALADAETIADLAKAVLIRSSATQGAKWGHIYELAYRDNNEIVFTAMTSVYGSGKITAEEIHLKSSGSEFGLVEREGQTQVLPTVNQSNYSSELAGDTVWTLEW